MRNTRWQAALALALVVVLVAAACWQLEGQGGRHHDHDQRTAADAAGGDGRTRQAGRRSTAPGVTDTEIRVGGVASVTNPLGGKYGDAFDGTKAYFDMVNAPAASTAASSCSPPSATTRSRNNKVRGAGPAHPGQRLRRAAGRHAAVHRRPDRWSTRASPRSAGPSTPSGRARPRTPRATSSARPARTSASTAPARRCPGWPSASAPTRSACWPTPCPQSADCADGVKNSFDKYGTAADAKLAFIDKSLPFGAADLSVQVSKMKEAGRRLRHHLHGHQRRRHPGQGDEEAAAQGRAVPARTPTTTSSSTSSATCSRAPTSAPTSCSSSSKDKPQGPQELPRGHGQGGRRRRRRTRLVGWLNADLFVDRPRGGRAELQPPEGHRRHQQDDRLHAPTGSSTASTGPRSTPSSRSRARPASSSRRSRTASSTRSSANPGKPFVCAVDEGGKLDTRYDRRSD